jgi:outer membrane receptor protein involved in Fe transport
MAALAETHMTPSAHIARTTPPALHRARALRVALLGAAVAAACSAHAAAPADLTALSLEQLLDIGIVGASKYEQKQNEVAAAVSVITRQEIRAFGWRTLDEALATLPGVHTTYDRQYTYFGTRGFGLPGDYNTRALVTINGNRFNDPLYDGGPFGTQFPLDMDLIERIEFIPGPGGAVYGQNAMFGVINVVTRSGADLDGAELALAYQHPQALRQGRASWGRRFGNGVDMLLSVTAMRARGADRFYDFGTETSGVAAGLDGERDNELFARIARGAWSFEHVYGARRKNDPTGVYFSDPLVAGQYQSDSYALTQLQYQDHFAANTLQVSARLFAGAERYGSVLSYGTRFAFPARSDWRGAELRLLSTAWAGHKLMIGLEGQDNTRTEQAVQDLAEPANNLLIRSPGYRVGLYAQDEWRLGDSWLATLGLRLDRNDVTGTQSSPRAALIWQAAPNTTLKLLYGRAHRAPNAYERDYDDGFAQLANPALRGESIDTLEFVADRRIGSDLGVRASLYQWDMRNLVTLSIEPASGMAQYRSGEKVKARGLELSADKTWQTGARLRGSLSLQDVASASGAELLNSPQALGKLNASAPLPVGGLRAGYELQYDAPRLTVNGTRLGGYAVSNLFLATDTWARGLELSLGIHNLFDKRYAHPGADTNWQNALVQDGRSIRAKLSYRL